VLSIFIERAERMQLHARAVRHNREIEPALSTEAHDYILKPKSIGATFHYFARRVIKKDADVLE
jgi:L-fuculose-phosphate aldolase